MGTPYLLDSNVIIYFLDAKLPDSVLDDIESKLNDFGSIMSVISKIELLGWQAPSSDAMLQIINFVNDSTVVPLINDCCRLSVVGYRLSVVGFSCLLLFKHISL